MAGRRPLWAGGRWTYLGRFRLGLALHLDGQPLLLLGWFLGQTAELALAGAVVGSGLAGRRVWRLFWVVVGLVVVCILATIILQSLGPRLAQ